VLQLGFKGVSSQNVLFIKGESPAKLPEAVEEALQISYKQSSECCFSLRPIGTIDLIYGKKT